MPPFSRGAICISFDDQENNICTLPSHMATMELDAKGDSHRDPVVAVCESRVRIDLLW